MVNYSDSLAKQSRLDLQIIYLKQDKKQPQFFGSGYVRFVN